MRKLHFAVVSLFLTALLSVSAFAQTQTAGSSGKFAVINMFAFDDAKGGITKYVNAMNTLETEFKPINTELQTMATKYQTLGSEIKTLQDRANDPTNKVPFDPKVGQAKIDEYGKLERDIKFKQEDAKARYQSRYNAVMGPVMQDILKAMQDFAKQKGYAMIFDAAKLEESNLVIAVGDEKVDVTKDFITFYNTRPATTAAAVTKP